MDRSLSAISLWCALITCASQWSCDDPKQTDLENPLARGGVEAPASEVPLEGPWLTYTTLPPSEDQAFILQNSPYLYPTRSCRARSSFMSLPESAQVTVSEEGEELLCVWNSPTAAAPEGIKFNEVGECEHVFTQAPSWFTPPQRVYASPMSLLDDPAYQDELRWAQSQVNSSGCGCCHSSALASGNTSGWDAGAPAVWTDTLSNARLYLLSGMISQHSEFGAFAPEEAHGASREEVMIPSVDPVRLRGFFLSEFERRGGTSEDKEAAQRQMDALFSRKGTPPRECISPFEGVSEGLITWNGTKLARQVYVQEVGSEVPGFPPNLDRPVGTVWAFRVAEDQEGLASGVITLGDLPEGAIQLVPADGSRPRFESGRPYRLFVTPDVMLLNLANCLFTSP